MHQTGKNDSGNPSLPSLENGTTEYQKSDFDTVVRLCARINQ